MWFASPEYSLFVAPVIFHTGQFTNERAVEDMNRRPSRDAADVWVLHIRPSQGHSRRTFVLKVIDAAVIETHLYTPAIGW